MIDYDKILPDLYIGTYPQDFKDVQEIGKELRITAVLNLQSDEDLRHRSIDWKDMETLYKNMSIEVYRAPMRDFDYEDQKERLPETVKALSKLLASGHLVYLHCNAGVGRSPLVAMAYLYWCRNMDFKEAVRYVRACRLCSPNEALILDQPKSRLDGICSDSALGKK